MSEYCRRFKTTDNNVPTTDTTESVETSDCEGQRLRERKSGEYSAVFKLRDETFKSRCISNCTVGPVKY